MTELPNENKEQGRERQQQPMLWDLIIQAFPKKC